MITDTTRLTLMLFVEHLGVPLRQVLALDRQAWYERVTERLIAANGDALDVLTAQTPDPERQLILKAGALVRLYLDNPHLNQE